MPHGVTPDIARAGTEVTRRVWTPPLIGAPQATSADGAGNVAPITILVLPHEKPGPRMLAVIGAGGASLTRTFLVVPAPAGPPDADRH